MSTRPTRITLAVFLALAGIVLAVPAPVLAGRPLETAVVGPDTFREPGAELAFQRVARAGASATRIVVGWSEVAPSGARRPAGFDPADPADSHYSWGEVDGQVRLAAANGLEPWIEVHGAPRWAERGDGGPAGTNRPDPDQLASFLTAAARRYDGTFAGLPRVRHWQVWNEPNASFFLGPQLRRGRPSSPALYRALVNHGAAAVRAVAADNVVIAGGLFPFTIDRGGARSIGPLRFMRGLFCLDRRGRSRSRCPQTSFDVWSTHPYTSGGPTHHAFRSDDVSLGDLGEMRRMLSAAVRARRIDARRPVAFWVDEFSWDSRPPDPGGVPERLHARWVAEALYRMHRAGVTRVAWFLLRDDARGARSFAESFESGLYRRCARGIACDRPKLALRAFRFPFVAFRRAGGRVAVWGRTPGGASTPVQVEQSVNGRWRRLATLRPDAHGVFERRLRPLGRGALRARLASGADRSVAFSLRVPRDRAVNPFGG